MILGLLFSGCPEDSSPEQNDAGDDGDDGVREAGARVGGDAGSNPSDDADAKVGTFTLRLVPPTVAMGSTPASAGYTAISGKVFSGPVPEEVAWDVDVEQGGCKLLKPRVPFCDPGCDQDVCVDDDQCAPNPKAASAGTVTLSGLKSSAGGSAEIKIEPIAASYATPSGISLAYPAFDEGAELKLSAKGADAPAFEITSHGIAPLSLSTTTFELKSGSAFALAWQAPGKSEFSRIQVKLDISHHGGTKGKVECDVPDTGSLSVPADLVTRLLKLGSAGFPTVVVDRVSSASASTKAGSVELKVVSEIEQGVQIEGLTSCSDNADCPQGKTCQSDLSCK
jgi:hypothetical protein